MIEPSTNFPHVLKCICDFDESVKYDSLKFIGYIRDLYCGRKELMDDFVIVLTELETIISSRSFSEIDLSKINLEGAKSQERKAVQSEIFKYIYINSDLQKARKLNELIIDVYEQSSKPQVKSYNSNQTSSIIFFRASSLEEIEFGKILTLSWKCNNPYKISLFNGHDYMDVSHMDTISISAMFDKYVLLLSDKSGNVIDTKEIRINFRKNSFCMNCGTLIYSEGDIYCTHCGIKL